MTPKQHIEAAVSKLPEKYQKEMMHAIGAYTLKVCQDVVATSRKAKQLTTNEQVEEAMRIADETGLRGIDIISLVC
jgi:hypothetical protein